MLDRISIAAPCTADWESMRGTDRVRHCGECNKNVYNLSEMTRWQAEALLRETEGQLCVRLYRRGDGTVLTSNCPAGLRAIGRGISRMAGAALSAMMTLSSATAQFPLFQIAAVQEKDSSSSIIGMVHDAAGGVISDALVKMIRNGPDEPLTARTDDKGKFSMKSLSPGLYKIRIESPGFMTFTKEVSLRAHQEFKISATLHVGAVGTVIEVLPAK
jgi:hypothetical protein